MELTSELLDELNELEELDKELDELEPLDELELAWKLEPDDDDDDFAPSGRGPALWGRGSSGWHATPAIPPMYVGPFRLWPECG